MILTSWTGNMVIKPQVIFGVIWKRAGPRVTYRFSVTVHQQLRRRMMFRTTPASLHTTSGPVNTFHSTVSKFL